MSGSLAKAIVIAVPVSLLLAWSLWTFTVTHTSAALLRLVGATCLVVVVVVHVAEAMHWFPGMGWGQTDKRGALHRSHQRGARHVALERRRGLAMGDEETAAAVTACRSSCSSCGLIWTWPLGLMSYDRSISTKSTIVPSPKPMSTT